MKIVHICLTGAVSDGFTYQDNMLSKYHKKLGYDVSIITSKWVFDENGEISRLDKTDYYNDDNVFMIRLDNAKNNLYTTKIKRFIGLAERLEEQKPDIIFIHGVQFLDIKEIAKYAKKNPNVRVFADNHADFSNSGRNFISKNILQKIVWRRAAQTILPYTEKFYGVLPARVNWLVDMYGIPKNKCELLVMGADDEAVEAAYDNDRLNKLKEKYEIEKDDFVIVTGGKIDSFKLQTLLLMKAVAQLDANVKLIVFGSVQKDIQNQFNELCDNKKIKYAGWIKGNQSYELFALADLVVFPGRHSVYWEQVAGMGIPMVCKYWEGTTHVDIGGNVKFLYKDSVDELCSVIGKIVYSKEDYNNMLKIAKGEAKKQFSYCNIAKKSLRIK